MLEWLSGSDEDTFQLGCRIGENTEPGDIILLYGDLGSGKTIMTKGIAYGVGVSDMVTSPTFTLMNQYSGRIPVYHFDIYRLNHPEELYDLDYEEYLFGNGIAIVEWPERMGDLLPEEYLKITLNKTQQENQRKITLEPHGSKYMKRVEALVL